MVTVNNTSELSSELASSAGGKDIVLAEGVSFGPLGISNVTYTTANTIRSANPSNPSTIVRFTTQNCGNLIFQDVDFVFTDTSQADTYKHISIYNTTDITFDRCLFQMTQSGGTLNKGNALGVQLGSGLTVRDCEFVNLHSGITILDCDDNLVEGCEFHIIRTDCVNVNDCDNTTIQDNYMHDSATPIASDHVDMIQFARGTTRGKSVGIYIKRNVMDMGILGNWGQSIHFGLDGKTADASTLHDDILIEDNLVYQGHSNAISFDWVDNCVIRNNSFMSGPPADIFSEPALKILSSASNTVTIERNIFCQNQTTFGGGWTHSDNFYLAESTYATNFNENARSDVDGYNDLEIKSGTAHHTALAGSRMQPREGGWGGNGIAPHPTYQALPAGFQGSAPPVSNAAIMLPGGQPLIVAGQVLSVS